MEPLIMLLIYIVLIVVAAGLVIWVLGQLGVALPPIVVKGFWVIVVLIIVLIFWRMVGPTIASGHLPGLK